MEHKSVFNKKKVYLCIEIVMLSEIFIQIFLCYGILTTIFYEHCHNQRITIAFLKLEIGLQRTCILTKVSMIT